MHDAREVRGIGASVGKGAFYFLVELRPNEAGKEKFQIGYCLRS